MYTNNKPSKPKTQNLKQGLWEHFLTEYHWHKNTGAAHQFIETAIFIAIAMKKKHVNILSSSF